MRIQNIIASVLLAVPVLSIATPAQAAGPGEFCGGMTGITCDSGLYCEYDGSYPDAGGTCLPDMCGGIGAIPCPDGYTCVPDGPYPDASGYCAQSNSCEDMCGGQSLDQSCWCDWQCEQFGDCCDDKQYYCGIA